MTIDTSETFENDKVEEELKQEEELINHERDDVELNTVDDVMIWLGGRNSYSLMILVCTFFVDIFAGFATLCHIFVAAKLSFTCNAVLDSVTSSNCSNDISNDQCFIQSNCSNSPKISCTNYSYDTSLHSLTIVNKFNLVCHNSFYASIPSTSYFCGVLLGSTIYGYLSDKIGRQKCYLLCSLNVTTMLVAAALSPNYWLYTVCQFFSGMGGGGMMTNAFALALEGTDIQNRATWVLLMTNGWATACLLLPLIAYFYSNYQILLLILAGMSVISIPIILFMGESIRWLVISGKVQLADKAIKRAAKFNKMQLPVDFSSARLQIENHKSPNANILDLFKRPGIRRVTLLTWLLFAIVSLSYYGITLGIGFLGGNIFLNQVYSALVEPPARIFGTILSFKIKRRLHLVLTFGLAGVSLILSAILFQFDNLISVRIAFAMHGKFWITIAFDLVWIYTGEAFPTVLRSVAVGTGSTMARFGSIFSTLIGLLAVYWAPLPFAVIGFGPFVACFVVYFLPETFGAKLTESVDECEDFIQGRESKVAVKTFL